MASRDAAVQRMLDAEDVAEGVGGRQRHRGGADDRGVEQHDGEQGAGGVTQVAARPWATPPASVKWPAGRAGEGEGGGDDEQAGGHAR